MDGGLLFFIVTLGFAAVGLLASLGVPIVYNKGSSTNRLHLLLVITAVICAWMMWAIVYMAQWKPLVNPILSES
ncbi:hypothetical protein GOP47_0014843 [Adiantum capillus-veneris]|uniref:Uncharacterized protein n=1 Tax=Adiantum capillus-veneris TaxID=13818 RepID=A0A9D4UM92_ADICA|nr:hypothetical protein GOP47_0014843 [Adiantum capillus-veneris]